MKSEEDKRKYIQEFEEKEGITLNEENIKFNLGLRSLAKLALNSFYGRFSQRVNMQKCISHTSRGHIQINHRLLHKGVQFPHHQ